jgi:hypothetical protein
MGIGARMIVLNTYGLDRGEAARLGVEVRIYVARVKWKRRSEEGIPL